ncbi:uncharacterized protein N7482_001368 [Penicillium canariense]|uniref:Hydrophobin n=1 Tax=Penicillium canariense TaxID=189055 RepID=A0A9W9LT08_9EURO|nr:uncharacterized protein N7482_001368 [Penicillium canariense]KAJ5175491.1 hypothetical protein N7482_001368 [Penicillium canariense]
MKYTLALSALFVTALAIPTGNGGKGNERSCENHETVVCKGNGEAGLLSLGNILTGLLGSSCSNGNFYCCTTEDVEQHGLINLDLNLQCALNDIL